MVYWGEDQNLELVRCIERGDIDPHNADGDYLFGKTVQLFKGFEGDGTTRSRANVIARLRKMLRNYCFDGLCLGGKNELQVSSLPHIHYFYRRSPLPF